MRSIKKHFKQLRIFFAARPLLTALLPSGLIAGLTAWSSFIMTHYLHVVIIAGLSGIWLCLAITNEWIEYRRKNLIRGRLVVTGMQFVQVSAGKWIIHYTLVNTSQVMLFINYIREGFRIGLTGCEDEYGNATAIALAPGESRSQGSGFIPTGDIAGKVGRAELTIDYGKKSNELWERMGS